MSKSYVIERVSPEPKTWESKFGPMVTYRVMFEGLQEPVEINKKPDSPKPNKGDEVFGHIETTEYGKKFKSEPNPNFATASTRGGGFTKKEWQPRDDDRIVAQWAIGQAVHMYCAADPKPAGLGGHWIKDKAIELYAMVEEVKGGVTEESGYDKAKATAASLKTEKQDQTTANINDNVNQMDVVADYDIGDEPINLDDIPF